LLECGAGWLPYYAHRLDEHLEVFGFPTATLSLRPSEYVRRQCYVSVEEVEPGLAQVVDAFPQSVVFASDYPHADGIFPGATKEIAETDVLDDPAKRRVLVDNASRLYAL
jgi:predicted TIM-barrel fold metal-dependent hydrolase